MAKFPIAALFSIQVVMSGIGVAVIVALFAVFHEKSVETAAQSSIQASLKYAEELIASPLRAVVPQMQALADTMKATGDLCNDGRTTALQMAPTMHKFLPLLKSQSSLWAVYSTFRMPNVYEGRTPNSTNSQDYPWTDCGCTQPTDPLNHFCTFGYDNSTGRNTSSNNPWWGIVPNLYPQLLPIVVARFPHDTRQQDYAQELMTWSRDKVNGSWRAAPGIFQIPNAVDPKSWLSAQIGYCVPLTFDSRTDLLTSGLCCGMDLPWMVTFLKNMGLAATRAAIIQPENEQIIASSFDLPILRIPNASVQYGEYYNSTNAPDATLRDAIRSAKLAAGGASLTQLKGVAVILGREYLVGARLVELNTTRLMVITVTERAYYFAEGDRVRTQAIIIGVAVFVALTITVVLLVLATTRPLGDVSQRLTRMSRLRPAEDIADLSMISEVASMQKSYNTMNVAITSFTRYVPRDVVKDLMKSGQLCKINFNTFYCSVLFIDIVSFTSICERLTADTLAPLVTLYFEQMSSIVLRHDGLIDKFIGDCIMAIWGAPHTIPNHEVRAALCALNLRRETQVEPLRGAFDNAGEFCDARIGVNSGNVLGGNMGSAERMNYTVIGDAVNLSARLEAGNKHFGTRILIAEATASALQGVCATRLIFPLRVVGKEEPVNVYELVGMLPDARDDAVADSERPQSSQSTATTGSNDDVHDHFALREMIRSAKATCTISKAKSHAVGGYTQAVHTYCERRFADAIRLLDTVGREDPDVSGHAGEQLRSLCEKYIATPPSDEEFARGVFKAESK